MFFISGLEISDNIRLFMNPYDLMIGIIGMSDEDILIYSKGELFRWIKVAFWWNSVKETY